MLLDQALAIFLQPLKIPFGLLEGLALTGHFCFRGVAGASLGSEALLEILLLGL